MVFEKTFNSKSTNKPFDLFIENADKSKITLKVTEEDTVKDVLTILQNRHGIQTKFSLVHKFRELLPSRTLKSYLIGSEPGRNNLLLRTYEKRDELKRIEKTVQKWWNEEKVFEENAPEKSGKLPKKFFVTFPFPYVNGLLHCGHGFSLTKAEFAAGYQRLKGKQVLFPFAFHCTGMPIVASANKLKKEIENFGNPPVFPVDETPMKNLGGGDFSKNDQGNKKRRGKGKIAKKKSKELRQFNIMRELGVPEEQIGHFSDPKQWVRYFAPKAFEHLKQFGAKIDSRRSFVTTDMNPFFSRFVEWQFNTLKSRGFVSFGKRMCVFSPRENQPCADHDRASGEGVQPQEYTAIKLKIVVDEKNNSSNFEKIAKIISEHGDKETFLVAGTLRPETMYGQTNCFVKPNGEYVVIETNQNELFICSERSAKNMSFQGVTPKRGVYGVLRKLKGWDLLGLKVEAPKSIHGRVFILPLPAISMSKATAIVTSVPSDSPDDYINYSELRNNSEHRDKYHIDEKMVSFEVTPIIRVPELGNLSALDAIQKFKIKSPNDEKKLKEAKELVYLKGFYKGVLLVGNHKDKTVEEAKDKVKEELIKSNEAFSYFEPAEPVVSRTGENCVVAETDQWFLNYGEEPLKSEVENHIRNNMNFYSGTTKKSFLNTVDWMKQWACSRKFGLGTKLPFDKEWLIESLSDSTIYMSFYTIAQFFEQGLEISPSDKRKKDFKAEDFTDEVFDAIFIGGKVPGNGFRGVDRNTILKMKKEFEYWYPMDLRVSGKDLINNHLVMSLYNHAFIWPKMSDNRWPQSMFANGHALINSEKMSKSTGNFFTLKESIDQYSADATRLAFADAGDGLEDANFSPDTCNATIMRLDKELNWVLGAIKAMEEFEMNKETTLNCHLRTKDNKISFRKSETKTFADQIFINEIKSSLVEAEKAYEEMKFRVALNKGFYAMCSSKSFYISLCSGNLNIDTVRYFIRNFILVIAPICSHWSEFLWRRLGNKTSLFAFRNGESVWPSSDETEIDRVLERKSQFLREAVYALRMNLLQHEKRKIKRDIKFCYVFVAENQTKSRGDLIKEISELAQREKVNFDSFNKSNSFENFEKFENFTKWALSELKKKFLKDKQTLKHKMMLSSFILKEAQIKGNKALETKMPFNQKEILEEHLCSVLTKEERERIGELKVLSLPEGSESLSKEGQKELKRLKVGERTVPGTVSVFLSERKLE